MLIVAMVPAKVALSTVELLVEVLLKVTMSPATGTMLSLQLLAQLQVMSAPQPPSQVLDTASARPSIRNGASSRAMSTRLVSIRRILAVSCSMMGKFMTAAPFQCRNQRA